MSKEEIREQTRKEFWRTFGKDGSNFEWLEFKNGVSTWQVVDWCINKIETYADQEVKEVRDKAIQEVLEVAKSISFNTEDQAGIKFIAVVLEELEEKLKIKSV